MTIIGRTVLLTPQLARHWLDNQPRTPAERLEIERYAKALTDGRCQRPAISFHADGTINGDGAILCWAVLESGVAVEAVIGPVSWIYA